MIIEIKDVCTKHTRILQRPKNRPFSSVFSEKLSVWTTRSPSKLEQFTPFFFYYTYAVMYYISYSISRIWNTNLNTPSLALDQFIESPNFQTHGQPMWKCQMGVQTTWNYSTYTYNSIDVLVVRNGWVLVTLAKEFPFGWQCPLVLVSLSVVPKSVSFQLFGAGGARKFVQLIFYTLPDVCQRRTLEKHTNRHLFHLSPLSPSPFHWLTELVHWVVWSASDEIWLSFS